jgi:hypothetical protein
MNGLICHYELYAFLLKSAKHTFTVHRVSTQIVNIITCLVIPIHYLIRERVSATGIVPICAYQRGIAYCDIKISFDWLPLVLIYITYIVNKRIHTNAHTP